MKRRLSDLNGPAVWLAGAMIVNNVFALLSSVVFARVLDDYGALAALVSYLLILTVVGQALQLATARESVLGRLGVGTNLLLTLERWGRTLAIFTVAATVISILLRQPIADLVGVKHDGWAAAAGIPAGCIYVAVCVLRGALQGVGDYRSVGLSLVGEQGVRLVCGAALVALGLGVGGAYLGSLLSYLAMAGYCVWRLWGQLAEPGYRTGHRFGMASGCALPLKRHIANSAIPIAALGVIQLLQNIDLITAKHQFDDAVASSYAVAAVAAKVLIWVAMGAGYYLVPETSKRDAEGKDTRPVLLQSLGIIAICAIPCMLIFAFAAHPLLAAVFGEKRAIASDSLLPLGAAFTALAATYLAVQYMLALKRHAFLAVIGSVAVIEPILLLQAPKDPASFAAVVLGVQTVGAILAYMLALSGRSNRSKVSPPPEAVTSRAG
jgi:O-antigen/teichoic acid export membrane protein